MPEKITIQYDGKINIATGRSRKETSWRNIETLRSDFLTKLSNTHYTAETHVEYMTAKKSRQDEIKDIGGFVGGYVNSGRRKAGNVLSRDILTLDIDFGTLEFWSDYLLLFGNLACIYSTHKHSPDSPRFRLIIFLNRSVQADEYEAIARKVAGDIDIEIFDPTTFQPERLMYWPSTSKGGEYVFQYCDGPLLNADEVLNSYHDWRDSSAWPVSSRVDKILQRSILKQGDPLEKPGIVGTFCRVYSIHEAIEKFLPNTYAACDVENRFTYLEGSTAAGLIVYEDKFAYSHHGTDPTSGKLCNAFDLVRIHKYGLKDDVVKEGTPVNKFPSHLAMIDFAAALPEVKKLSVNERLAKAGEDFADMDLLGENDLKDSTTNEQWVEKLDVDRKGNIYSTIANVAVILENDPRLKGLFATDAFRDKRILTRRPLWRNTIGGVALLEDTDEQNLVKYLEKGYGISTRTNIKDAFDIHCAANTVHPVRDYLSGLEWDRQARVNTLFADYLGAEDSEYLQAVTRKTLCAAVARVYQPGIKFDYVLTLVGPQGKGKSTIIAKLGGQWFSDSFSFNMLHSKEAFEQLIGFWLIEIGELAGLRKADVEGVKQFISKQEDSFRKAYGRNTTSHKRQCIFIGSSNNKDFLRDPTGNRRFWIVDIDQQQPTKDIFKNLTPAEVAQVWAEAVQLYKAGEPLFLSAELEAEAMKIQQDHAEINPQAGIVENYLDILLPTTWNEKNTYERRQWLGGDELQAEGVEPRKRVCVAELWCEALGGMQKDMTTQNTKELHNIMRKLEGWKEYPSKTSFKLYGNQRGYYKTMEKILPQAGKYSHKATEREMS